MPNPIWSKYYLGILIVLFAMKKMWYMDREIPVITMNGQCKSQLLERTKEKNS
jgi:hypothetical protein